LLLTIYPFESKYYQQSSLPVEFVGNPLSEYLGNYSYNDNWKNILGIPSDTPLIALFPGSRKSELERNLPIQLDAVALLLEQQPEPRAIAISCTFPDYINLIHNAVIKSGLERTHKVYIVPQEFTYELMREAHAALAKSGTVTLELALHHCPTVVTYKLSTFNYYIAKYLMRIQLPHYCIVNILLDKETFPEYIEKSLSPQAICQHLQKIDSNTSSREECLLDLKSLSNLLSGENASKRAAEAISRSLK
jgi:lipid-A-disaccharide synthase